MDFYQLKTIVKYSLIQELRISRATGRKHAIGRTLIFFLCFYTMAGMLMVFLLFAVKDPFTGSMVITTLSIKIYGSDEKTRENLSQYIVRPPISLKKVFYEPFHSKVLFKTKYNDYFPQGRDLPERKCENVRCGGFYS